jgi:HEAT repeat protein
MRRIWTWRQRLVAGAWLSTWLASCLSIGATLFAEDADITALASHLASKRSEERVAALSALARLHTPDAITAAIDGERRHEQFTEAEIDVLAQVLSGQDAGASVALLQAPEAVLVQAAIHDLGHRPGEQLLPIVQALRVQPGMEKLLKQILIIALAKTEASSAHVALLMLVYQSSDLIQRLSAVQSLRISGTMSEATATAISTDAAPEVRLALIDDLSQQSGRLQDASTPWVPGMMRKLIKDEEPTVRAAAYKVLMDRSFNRLPQHPTGTELELFLTGFADRDVRVRTITVDYFRRLREPAAAQLLEHACADPEGVVASIALEGVQHLGLPSLADLAYQACTLPHPQNRRTGLQILQSLHDPRLAQVATRLLADADATVRATAQTAMRMVGAGVEGGGAALATAAQQTPSESQALLVRWAQMDAPARLAEVSALFAGLNHDQQVEQMQRFARDWQLARSAVDFLLERARDADPVIASLALAALHQANRLHGHWGVPEALDRVQDADARVQGAARQLITVAMANGWGTLIFELGLGLSDVNPESPRPPVDVAAACAAAVAAPPAEQAARFDALAGIDDERAAAVLHAAASSPDRTTRWAALGALVRRGDQSDATLDFALARILVKPAQFATPVLWPALTPKLLVRLDTFVGLAEQPEIDRVRAEIERRLALVTHLEPLR